jgi:hypothetical protein
MSKAEGFRQCRGSRALGPQIQDRTRETSLDGPCAYMDASCGTQRANFWRRRQSARDQGSVKSILMPRFYFHVRAEGHLANDENGCLCNNNRAADALRERRSVVVVNQREDLFGPVYATHDVVPK